MKSKVKVTMSDSDSGKIDRVDTNKLIVNGQSMLTGPFKVTQLGGCGQGVVFDTPVCFNNEVKGLVNCIEMQYEGVPAVNTPHKGLNFLGTGAMASDAGNTVATINLTGGGSVGTCIEEGGSIVCIEDAGAEGEEEVGSNASLYMQLDDEEYFLLKGTGALLHGQSGPSNGVGETGSNSFASGGPAFLGEEGSFDSPEPIGNVSQSFGSGTTVTGIGAYAEGIGNEANGIASFTTGLRNMSEGDWSHTEGVGNTADGNYQHIEGNECFASGVGGHVEGFESQKSGNWNHAEGLQTTADGSYNHTDGYQTFTGGFSGHAHGAFTQNSAQYCHTEGNDSNTLMFGGWSLASGRISGTGITLNTLGTAQLNKVVLRNWVPHSSTNIPLYLNGTSLGLFMQDAFSWVICGKIIARSYAGNVNADTDVAGWSFEAVVDKSAPTDLYHPRTIIRSSDFIPVYVETDQIIPSFTLVSNQPVIQFTTGPSTGWHIVACLDITMIRNDSIRDSAV